MHKDAIQQLSFDAVLPMCLFYNKHIEPNALKLYAVVRNLTRLQGYCFASNEYLADLMDFDVSSIKRWIRSLTKQGYLEIETDKAGINWHRRIYLSDKFKKSLRRLNSDTPPAQNCAPPSSKLSHIKEEENKEEKKKESAKAHSSDQTETVRSKHPEIKFSFDIYRFENIETRDLESWKELYPTVDIDRELKAMTEWIWSNQQKAKGKKHWRKFINHWLSKNYEQNINKEAYRSRGFSNEIDRRPRDKDGNVKPSQYAGLF